MCGISGYINLDGEKASYSIIKSMNDAISHRGPDGEGFWIEKELAIGHRRLSIIDLTDAGKQPMISHDNRYVISYNGEIFNFKEIKKDLINQGINFKSNSDTEVLINSVSIWGMDAFKKFNGMFACAIWDKQERNLYLVRDRYGIKPIYYALQGNIFFFGSEQKAITSNPKFKKSFNKNTLKEYFTFQNIFTENTFLKDIRILKSGSFLKLNLSCNNSIDIFSYWDFNFQEPSFRVNEEEYIEELQRLFKIAVERQLVADVEVGAYLSGGLDSGAITAIASKRSPNLKTFTCGFDLSSAFGIELNFDERSKAEALSSRYETEHYEMILNSRDMEKNMPAVVNHIEEQRVGQSYPNYCVAKMASKFVKVVLAGTGGDELFAGYPWRYYKITNCNNFESYVDNYYSYWQRLVNNEEIKKLFSPIWKDISGLNTKDIFQNIFPAYLNNISCPEDSINYSLYLEAKTFLHGLFVVEDKLSMAHGLETRVPFMDNDLVDFAMSCPVNLKLRNLSRNIKLNENIQGNKKDIYNDFHNDGKIILRKAMKEYMPPSQINARKQGFSSPDASWFRCESINFVKNILLDKKMPLFDYLDFKTTSEHLEDHLSGRKNKRLLIWSLLAMNQWIRGNL